MNDGLVWLLWAAGAWIGLQLITAIVLLIQLLRAPFRPSRLSLRGWHELPTPELQAHQRVWLDEIRALGFEPVWQGEQHVGERHHPVVILKHTTDAAYAMVTFQASMLMGYPVSFHSLAPDGLHLKTQNRMGWLALDRDGATQCHNVTESTLVAVWQAHRARIPAGALADDARAVEAIKSNSDGSFEALRASGALAQSGDVWHLTLATALRSVWYWRRVRKALAKPIESAMFQGEHLTEYMAQAYVEHEALMADRPQRHNVKALVLVGSMALSLALWGVAFTWSQAVLIVFILLVHEFGHALAMRWFGWKDMSMFFIPFMGAMVTGKPQALPAWKQAVVLLAGPVPGLLAGVAILLVMPIAPDSLVDWRQLGLMAIGINLFNLMPVTPLDGGQLVELALFARWPRLRTVFAAASVLAMFGFAWWWRSEMTAVLGGLLAFSLMSQWRVARLQNAWREGLDHPAQLVNLFAAARRLMPQSTPTRLFVAVRAVFSRQLVQPPGRKASAVIMALLLTVWVGVGVLAFEQVDGGRDEPDTRTVAQQAFDQAWTDVDDAGPGTDEWARLTRLAGDLPKDDPRHADMAFGRIRTMDSDARQAAVDQLIRQGASGVWMTSAQLLSSELLYAVVESRRMSAEERLSFLQGKVAWAKRVGPQFPEEVMPTELWVAEALDDVGRGDEASKMLDELQARAETVDSCRCKLSDVVRARTWFHLSHQRSRAALNNIEGSTFAKKAAEGKGPLGIDYAWALLLDGNAERALAIMTNAARRSDGNGGLLDRLKFSGEEAWMAHPLDLAYAHEQAGEVQAAQELLARNSAKWQCKASNNGHERDALSQPWQRLRDQVLSEMAWRLCPKGA